MNACVDDAHRRIGYLSKNSIDDSKHASLQCMRPSCGIWCGAGMK